MNLRKSTLKISKMDCSAEEQLLRMKLSGDPTIHRLTFDLPGRKLIVLHEKEIDLILKQIDGLNLGTSLLESEIVHDVSGIEEKNDSRLLWRVLLINAFCFVLELATGIIAGSIGLVADSLDMLADTLVYSLSLYAVGGTIVRKKRIAKLSGYLQIALAIFGFVEVFRRFFESDSVPDVWLMISISLIALLGNVVCLKILQLSKSKEAHMKASMIFTSNDVVANFGVVIAGILVYVTGSNRPDLIIGSIIFVVVMRGAFRILQLAK
jgi:Co/Zn/Cd efflux system component